MSLTTINQMTDLGLIMPWPFGKQMEMPATGPSVPAARMYARHTLREWEQDGQAEAVELIVSELVTNAVRHGMTPVKLRLSSDGVRVFIQVQDRSPLMPVLHDVQPDAESCRGLVLVDRLSEHWGAYRLVRPDGKVVWSMCR
jgi:anti-sigma regulatory factor (Ser/Thr protein kinase)